MLIIIVNPLCYSNLTPIQEACSRSVSAFQTTIIPGYTIQLLSVSLPTEALTLRYSSGLIEPQDPDRSPLDILIARTIRSVSSDRLAIIHQSNPSYHLPRQYLRTIQTCIRAVTSSHNNHLYQLHTLRPFRLILTLLGQYCLLTKNECCLNF